MLCGTGAAGSRKAPQCHVLNLTFCRLGSFTVEGVQRRPLSSVLCLLHSLGTSAGSTYSQCYMKSPSRERMLTAVPSCLCCSPTADPGRIGGGQGAIGVPSRVSRSGFPPTRRPMARPGEPDKGGGTSGSRICGRSSGPGHRPSLPHREPAERCGAGPAVHLQRLQPAGPRTVHAVRGGPSGGAG